MVWKHRSYLLIILLEIKIFGLTVQRIHENSKNGSFCEELPCGNDFKAVLFNFCCYDFGANAAEPVQKISTGNLELYANSPNQLIL